MTKHCVITGAAQGIGLALSREFTEGGYHLTGIDIDPLPSSLAQEATAGASFLQGDLSDSQEVKRVVERLGEMPLVDVLIHCAGISHVAPFARSDLKAQRRVLAVNLVAPLLLTEGLLQAERLNSHGSIVFIASLSHFVGYPGAIVYAAGKDGLVAYAEELSARWGQGGGHVLTVYPGPTRTEHARRYSPDNSREHKRMAPEKVARMVYRAVQKRKRHLIPGIGNRIFSLLGRYFPWLTRRILCKAILNKLN